MDEDILIFVVLITGITCITAISILKIIFSHIKWKAENKNPKSSVGLGELESSIQRAVELANAPLAERLDKIESRLDTGLLPDATLEEELDIQERDKTLGRMSRHRSR